MMREDTAGSIVTSICCITYNHEGYIAQALDGFLIQETSFPFEIIVGEDCSADRTRHIVLEYQARYPQLIRLVTSETNVGMRQNGKRTRAAARGKYIALCEGDDYWTDPCKLQKQVDFLDSHPDAAICFHNVWVAYPDRPGMSHPFYVQTPDRPSMHTTPKPISTLEDLVRGNFIQTPSVMFRAGLFEEFPDWYYELDRGDWPLYVLNAQRGCLGYIDEVMAVYRVHSGGIYSSKSRIAQLEGAMESATAIDRHLRFEYHKVISAANADRLARIVMLLVAEKELGQARAYVWRYVTEQGLADRRARTLLRTLFEGYCPGVARAVRRLHRLACMAKARRPQA